MSNTLKSALSELYANHTQAEVGAILGVSQRTVSSYMKLLGIKARRQRTPAPKGKVATTLTRRGRTTRQSARQLFVKMYRHRGMSLRDIASAINTDHTVVRDFAISRNIPLRRWGSNQFTTGR